MNKNVRCLKKLIVLILCVTIILGVMDVYAGYTIPEEELSVYNEIKENAEAKQGNGSRSYVYSALCKLYTGWDIEKANKLLCEPQIVSVSSKETFEQSPFELYWSMPAYIKTYMLFNSKNGKKSSGLLEADTETHMEKVMRHFVESYYEGLFEEDNNPNRIVDSENHDMLKKTSVYLAVQCLFDNSDYTVLPDGKPAEEFLRQAEDFIDKWFTQRAKSGLLVEGADNYRTITLEGIYNLMDLSENANIRKKAKMFADVLWIEYATESLNGIRGGGKARVYNRTGDADNGFLWFAMLGSIYFGLNKEYNPSPVVSVLASDYRPPEIARQILSGRGESFEFVKAIPGCGTTKTVNGTPVYLLDTEKTVMSYQYITPDYIAGTLYEENASDLTLLSSQNRWQGVVFADGFNNRIYPYADTSASTHNNFSGVQNGPVMMFKKNSNIAVGTGIYISGFGEEVSEEKLENGWLFGRFSDAYYGIKPLNGFVYSVNGKLLLSESNSPFVIHTGNKNEDGSFETFKNRLKSNSFAVRGNFAYYRDSKWGEIALSENERLINGKTVEYNPEYVMKSPYIKSLKGSGVFDVVCNGKRIIYDFNKGEIYKIPYIAAMKGSN